MLLQSLLYPTKSDKGLTPGFFRRHTTSKIFFHGHFEMGSHFFVDFAIELFAAEEGENSVECLSEGITHRSLPSLCMARTRPMTPASRCQCAVSFTNCF